MPSLAGRLLYHAYHRPVGLVRESIAAGGPLEQWRTARGRRAMEAAAWNLPALPRSREAAPIELHLLSGRRFWYQSAFCLWSFARAAARPLAPIVYDDGTLIETFRAPLLRLFPDTRFVDTVDARACLAERLPPNRFPILHNRWTHYPNIRKLVDPHLAGGGWKLVIDSDLLFFRAPDLLVTWSGRPEAPLHAVDSETSYGYSRPLLESLAGVPLADRVNVGLCGLRSDDLDWEKLERWCRTLIEREGTHYYLEQALVAMLVAGRRCTIAPARDYITLPVLPELRDCTAVMHHYVAGAKRWYFQHCWRRALAAAA